MKSSHAVSLPLKRSSSANDSEAPPVIRLPQRSSSDRGAHNRRTGDYSSLGYSGQLHQRNGSFAAFDGTGTRSWTSDTFKKWASMSIDRTRVRSSLGFSSSGSSSPQPRSQDLVQQAAQQAAQQATQQATQQRLQPYGQLATVPSDRQLDQSSMVQTSKPEEMNGGNKLEGPETTPYYFISDPSMSEEEDELSSSAADRCRKLRHQQSLKNTTRNEHETTMRTPAELDANSVGDTSLSSSGISPMPRFRIQFDTPNGDQLGTNTSKQSLSRTGSTKNNTGDDILLEMRKKIKAAAETNSGQTSKIVFSRRQSDSSEPSSVDKKRSTIGGGRDLLPPSLSDIPPSEKPTEDAAAKFTSDPDPQHESPSAFLTNVPTAGAYLKLPSLDGYRGGESSSGQTKSGGQGSSSGGSVQGVDIPSEQSGGESSASASAPFRSSPANAIKEQETTSKRPSTPQKDCPPTPLNAPTSKNDSPNIAPSDEPQIESEQTKRTRKKRIRFAKNSQSMGKTNQSPNGHRRVRSGDGVAANIMNYGREDWIGMNLDNLPLPDRHEFDEDDDDGSTLLKSDQKNVPSLFAFGNANSNDLSSVWEGFSVGSADTTSTPTHRRRHSRRKSHHSNFSDDALFFSDSSATATDPRHFRNFAPNPNFGRVWDGENTVRYVPKQTVEPNSPQSNISWLAAFQEYSDSVRNTDSYRGIGSLRGVDSLRGTINLQGLENLGEADSLRGTGSLRGIENMRGIGAVHAHFPETIMQEEETEESESSSGLSTSSSSYASDPERNSDGRPSIQSKSRPKARQKMSPDKRSKFDSVMKRVTSVLDMPLYGTLYKQTDDESLDAQYPTFYCPNCKTNQRAFITVANAAGQFESPLGYLAIYFGLYLVSTLFIFGLEEGWVPLDCVYFSVITLTTAGLGDFVPTTDGAKIACSCLIYFGVATIGLLLGSLLASGLDDASRKDAREAQIRDCPNCQRLEKLKLRKSFQPTVQFSPFPESEMFQDFTQAHVPSPKRYKMEHGYEELGEAFDHSMSSTDTSSCDDYIPHETEEINPNVGLELNEIQKEEPVPCDEESQQNPICTSESLDIVRRQNHTRHMSFDVVRGGQFIGQLRSSWQKGVDLQQPSIDERTPFLETNLRSSAFSHEPGNQTPHNAGRLSFFDDGSSSSSITESSSSYPAKPMSRLKAAKYVVLTLNQALVNSIFIIAVGSFGFYFIEDMKAVDSFYFTTVLLTSVGYGDIVPVTPAGKLFATIYVVVAGTVLLHNMSTISMIPLELRKRRIEHAVLGQFGNRLTDEELHELSTGGLIHRLNLAANRPDGLEECTREMFSLAMLVRLGRITEDDVKATFEAFRRLDIGNYGRLNSRTIIEGEVMRRRAISSKNLSKLQEPIDPWEQPQRQFMPADGLFPLPKASEYATRYPSVLAGSSIPYMKQAINIPMNHPVGPSPRRPSVDSSYSSVMSASAVSYANSFDIEAYERWAAGWGNHTSSPSTQRAH